MPFVLNSTGHSNNSLRRTYLQTVIEWRVLSYYFSVFIQMSIKIAQIDKTIHFVSISDVYYLYYISSLNTRFKPWKKWAPLATLGSSGRYSRRRVWRHRQTRLAIYIGEPCSSRWSWSPQASVRQPSACPPSPRSWSRDRWPRIASSGWARSTGRWLCRCGLTCTSVCPHSSPTASPWSLCRPKRTESRRVRRSLCLDSRCVRCDWSSVGNWSSSRPKDTNKQLVQFKKESLSWEEQRS